MKSIYEINYPEDLNVKYERIQYPATEKQLRLLPSKDSVKITEAEEITVYYRGKDDMMELSLLTDALQNESEGMATMNLVLPYLPYGRADRRFVPGDCFGLKAFGRFIDSLAYHRVLTVDVHSQAAHKYIANLTNLDPTSLIENAVREVGETNGWRKALVIYPDKSADRYHLVEQKPFDSIHCSKIRDAASGKLTGFEVPDVADFKSAIMVDDICDGGGTFIGVAEQFKKKHPETKLYLYITHGIFSKGVVPLLDVFDRIYTTDSFKSVNSIPRVTVYPVGGLVKSSIYSQSDLYAMVAKGEKK